MQHRYGFEALDRSLRDIMKTISPDRFHKPFGGINVVLGGDFRQTLPVIEKGGRSDIVNASILHSKLWDICQLFVLTQNMRLQSGKSDSDKKLIADFSKWVLDIGDGKLALPSNEYSQYDQYIEIPSKYCIQSPIASIDDVITSTYDGLENSYKSTTYLRERAILTPTNQVVNHLNDLIMDKIPGDPIVYYSSDMVQDDGTGEQGNSTFPIEYLNTIKISGLPVHELRLKEGIVVMLMRNLSQTLGLCNGTRLIVRNCMQHTVQCEVLSGNNVGAIHLIPRLDMCPSDTKLPFNFVRKQFPLQVCFAMTINKAQGQSLGKVGLYLPKPVFCHGQLYVAISRVTSPYGLKVYIETDHGSTTSITKNVVFEEIFYKLPTT